MQIAVSKRAQLGFAVSAARPWSELKLWRGRLRAPLWPPHHWLERSRLGLSPCKLGKMWGLHRWVAWSWRIGSWPWPCWHWKPQSLVWVAPLSAEAADLLQCMLGLWPWWSTLCQAGFAGQLKCVLQGLKISLVAPSSRYASIYFQLQICLQSIITKQFKFSR